MAKKGKIEPYFDETRSRWKIDVPASLAADGKRYKAWFKTRDLARDYLTSISENPFPASAIAPSLAFEADKARGILEPWNRDLVQAARELAEALDAIGDAGSLVDAATAFRLSHEARNASRLFGEAVAIYMDSRGDLREPTLKSYRYTLEKTFFAFKEKMMADIQTEHLEEVLAAKGPISRKMHTRNLKAFWKWASSAPRGWATTVTVNSLESVRSSSDADISILSLADVKALLYSAQTESPAAAAAFSIAIFGGVRMTELGKLTWANVGSDNIEIGKGIAKKHSRRLVPICPSLRAWLKLTRGAAPADHLIVPPNWADVSKSVRRRAGWDVAARLLENPPAPTRGKWPTNACRHTCASVQVAIGTPLEELTFKFGHSGGHDLLRKHYVSRLSKNDALSILKIGPAGTRITLGKPTNSKTA